MRYYYFWMHNKTSSKDDEPIRIKAKTEQEARERAVRYQPHRFTVGRMYLHKDFKKFTGWPPSWAQEF